MGGADGLDLPSGGAVAEAAAVAPDGAGTYFFVDGARELLYVGKAVHLRRRLHQHARAATAGGSGRMATVYRRTRVVRWEEWPDEGAAAAREADLIVALRPAGNAGTAGDGRWTFLTVEPDRAEGRLMRFELTPGRSGTRSRDGREYGCFPHLGRGVGSPPGIACTEGYIALLRLLWAAGEVAPYPAAIGGRSLPLAFSCPVGPELRPSLHRFLSGTSDRLLGLLASTVGSAEAFRQPALRRDLIGAAAFFAAGPEAVLRLRRRHGIGPGPLDRARIEDLLRAEVREVIGDFSVPPIPERPDDPRGRRDRRWH